MWFKSLCWRRSTLLLRERGHALPLRTHCPRRHPASASLRRSRFEKVPRTFSSSKLEHLSPHPRMSVSSVRGPIFPRSEMVQIHNDTSAGHAPLRHHVGGDMGSGPERVRPGNGVERVMTKRHRLLLHDLKAWSVGDFGGALDALLLMPGFRRGWVDERFKRSARWFLPRAD